MTGSTDTTPEPFVSVLTPVYNGAEYLGECIESVLSQTYKNWEYIIVNNASTDDTLAIARRYAERDPRIKIHCNETLLPIIENHNHAFRLSSPEAKYCKVVSADDWLFPHCLEMMVRLAEAHPSVGMVASYQLSGGGPNRLHWRVRCDQMTYPAEVTPGREICRSQMREGGYIFGAPTSLLYRADLVRAEENFFPNSRLEADASACYKLLQASDFGFVHQVLSYERDGHDRVSSVALSYFTYLSSQWSDLLEYGPTFFNAEELSNCIRVKHRQYYNFLGRSILERRDAAFWKYHRERLQELGYPFSYAKLGWAVLARLSRPILSLIPIRWRKTHG